VVNAFCFFASNGEKASLSSNFQWEQVRDCPIITWSGGGVGKPEGEA